ncbi:MAG: type II toxin-antitoxin system HicB family antitoxin [Chloroflexi bacterium]|nr:type II toxin-antitoxin system HicB family antitoxin [Chloroflexota bacterium]
MAVGTMISDFVQQLMEQAHFEQRSDGTYVGEVPGMEVAAVEADTLEECQESLQAELEQWLLFGLAGGIPDDLDDEEDAEEEP